ncbi:MAG: tetratricopeptide repeat protein [Ignavibacteriaceae bacterium]|nr:tetratricopeptide repeat protein [Ignavibacteriaceae bacterium]
MIREKKKITRKEIKEDRLVTFYYKAVSMYNQYQRQIMIGAIAVAVVIGGYYLMSYYNNIDNEEANLKLARVMKIYDAGQFQEAIDGNQAANIVGLKKLVEDYGSSKNGETAKIYLANSYYNLGKFDEALEAYDDYSGNSDLLKATAFAGMAACYEAKNETEKSIEYYLKASSVSPETVLNPQYMLFAGINYIKIGKNEDAKELFQTIKRDYQKSPFSRDVDKYLVQVE